MELLQLSDFKEYLQPIFLNYMHGVLIMITEIVISSVAFVNHETRIYCALVIVFLCTLYTAVYIKHMISVWIDIVAESPITLL